MASFHDVASGSAAVLAVLADGFEDVPVVGSVIKIASKILAVAEAKQEADEELRESVKAVDCIIAPLQR